MAKQKCVECKADVPAYLNYMCEKCWGEALTEKIQADEFKKRDSDQKTETKCF